MGEVITFYALVALSVATFVFYLMRPHGYMELPFLTSAVYLGWVLPQILSIRQGIYASNEYLTTLYMMSILCLVALLIGWRQANRKQWRVRPMDEALNLASLQYSAIIVTGIVGVAVLGVDLRPAEEKMAATWSGPIVIWYFFSNLKVVSLALSGILFFRRRSTLSTILLVINLMFYLPAILMFFRRRALAELAIAGCLALYFGRKKRLPRSMVVVGLVLGSFFVFAVGELRGLARGIDGEWRLLEFETIASVDFIGATPLRDEKQAVELTNALSLIDVSSRTGYHSFGLSTWDRFVFQYVPATFVGASVKQGLMADVGANLDRMMFTQLGYVRGFGSTSTGIAEAYVEFWYFGVIFFYLIALILGRYWVLANRGDVWSQGLYAAGVIPAVITVTAYASYFFVAGLLYFVVLNGIRIVLDKRIHYKAALIAYSLPSRRTAK